MVHSSPDLRPLPRPPPPIMLTLQSPVVAIYSTTFDVQKLNVLPTQCICVFLRISEQAAIISLYSIN